MLYCVMHNYCFDLVSMTLIPVADPGFSPGGCANSQIRIILQIFCQKLHENERIWTPRGGRASLAPPLRSANAYNKVNEKIITDMEDTVLVA